MIKMKYSIDKIENNIALLENIGNNELTEISIDLLPKEIEEGTILIKQDDKYIIDDKEKEKRKNDIINRFQRLKKK